MQIPRCYRCEKPAASLHRAGDCLQCGKKGFIAKECKYDNKELCCTCMSEGHRNVSNKLSAFTKLLRRQRPGLRRGRTEKVLVELHLVKVTMFVVEFGCTSHFTSFFSSPCLSVILQILFILFIYLN